MREERETRVVLHSKFEEREVQSTVLSVSGEDFQDEEQQREQLPRKKLLTVVLLLLIFPNLLFFFLHLKWNFVSGFID